MSTDKNDFRIYDWRYAVRGSEVRGSFHVMEGDAREHLDSPDDELTDEHWKMAARHLCPKHLKSCLDLDHWNRY